MSDLDVQGIDPRMERVERFKEVLQNGEAMDGLDLRELQQVWFDATCLKADMPAHNWRSMEEEREGVYLSDLKGEFDEVGLWKSLGKLEFRAEGLMNHYLHQFFRGLVGTGENSKPYSQHFYKFAFGGNKEGHPRVSVVSDCIFIQGWRLWDYFDLDGQEGWPGMRLDPRRDRLKNCYDYLKEKGYDPRKEDEECGPIGGTFDVMIPIEDVMKGLGIKEVNEDVVAMVENVLQEAV